MQNVSTRAGCCSNVGSKGELTVEYHTQVPSSLGGGYHRVVKGNSQATENGKKIYLQASPKGGGGGGG